MQAMKKNNQWVLFGLPLFYLAGVLFHLFDGTFPLMLVLTPWTIFITAIIGFFPEFKAKNYPLLAWALCTFLITLALEIIGVATGLIFGAYNYGPTLGLGILGVPLLIGINWTLIIMGSIALVSKAVQNKWLIALGTAFMTVAFDWIMEPVAIALDYWTWVGSSIPLQNYIAWFFISFVFARVYVQFSLQNKSFFPSLIVVVQAIFFLLLRIVVIPQL
ncbi:MAG: carotenoid biosynthesis protein [Spirochaetia bacterium]|nr:carotenoid biosynthesis protein [Spirochaetia bacterium]